MFPSPTFTQIVKFSRYVITVETLIFRLNNNLIYKSKLNRESNRNDESQHFNQTQYISSDFTDRLLRLSPEKLIISRSNSTIIYSAELFEAIKPVHNIKELVLMSTVPYGEEESHIIFEGVLSCRWIKRVVFLG